MKRTDIQQVKDLINDLYVNDEKKNELLMAVNELVAYRNEFDNLYQKADLIGEHLEKYNNRRINKMGGNGVLQQALDEVRTVSKVRYDLQETINALRDNNK